MKRSSLLVTGSVFVAAWMSSGVAYSQAPQTIHPDASPKGGSKSERTGESDVPLPKGSPSTGTVETGKSGNVNAKPNTSLGATQSARDRETSVPLPKGSPDAGTVELGAGRSSMTNIKQAQQALKDKGYDPGAVDGVMGTRTKEAIKSFQNASSLPVTGTLDAATSQQLGIGGSGSGMSKSSRNDMPSSNTTVGKDTDQPNLPAKSK